jgi:MEMO1 family protein
MSLDFMPSPSEEHPGLFIRDPYHYSDALLIIPPVLVECLQLFDGSHTDLDLRAALVQITGSLDVSEIQGNLVDALSNSGFLEDEVFEARRDARRREFAESEVCEPSHAGSAYPADPDELREVLNEYLADGAGPRPHENPFAIAAPHVSPEGGVESYRAAYRVLRPEHRDRTFVILATSHYGEPETFGLTRKNFRTPLGDAAADTRLVDWLAARGGAGVKMEDYCFSFEHTVEFQVVFLQHVLGPGVHILPVLCGPYAKSLMEGGKPEQDDRVKAFLDALGELNDREGDNLFWVLGVDMAHMGARYGDRFEAIANEGYMERVADRDRQRIECINRADAAGFWDLVSENRDDLKWCGAAPFYTFLKSIPQARGELLRYDQWNIDEHSTVSFAGMSFTR